VRIFPPGTGEFAGTGVDGRGAGVAGGSGSCRYDGGNAPPAGVISLDQTSPWIASLMNFTEPSHMTTTTPPGWLPLGNG
jgi:hypothetical protein